MTQDPTELHKPKLLVFAWETTTHGKSTFCFGKSVEGNYTIGVEEMMEKFWKWEVYLNDIWVMDSNSYPNGTCENKKDAIALAINLATTHSNKNAKYNWK